MSGYISMDIVYLFQNTRSCVCKYWNYICQHLYALIFIWTINNYRALERCVRSKHKINNKSKSVIWNTYIKKISPENHIEAEYELKRIVLFLYLWTTKRETKIQAWTQYKTQCRTSAWQRAKNEREKTKKDPFG